MSKTAKIFAKVEPEIKEQAKSVMEQLGIPTSKAVRILLHQNLLQRGILIEFKLPSNAPLPYGTIAEARFDSPMQKGIQADHTHTLGNNSVCEMTHPIL